MRKRFLRDGGKDNYSAGSPDNTGDGIIAGQAVGGAVDLMDDAWWMPAFKRPDGVMSVLVSERSIPRSIIVDQTGRRFVNEAAPVCHVRAPAACRPARSDLVRLRPESQEPLPVRRGDAGPDLPQRLVHVRADAPRRHPRRAGRGDRRARVSLRETVDRFNGFARDGKDPDFGRGDSAYDNYYGDPTLPQPTMDVIDSAPYYAARIQAGDLGTKGGLVVQRQRPGAAAPTARSSTASTPPATPRPR